MIRLLFEMLSPPAYRATAPPIYHLPTTPPSTMSSTSGKRKASEPPADDYDKKSKKASSKSSTPHTAAPLLSTALQPKSKASARECANALLAMLPTNATKQNAEAKRLLRAFPLVTAELEKRTAALARKNAAEGQTLPIRFNFASENATGGNSSAGSVSICLPEDAFHNVLGHLTGRDVVGISLVNKAWLSASRSPLLWTSLDQTSGFTNNTKSKNMTSVLQLLARPQFANLKALTLPTKIKLGKTSLKQIAKHCPSLEELDMGYTHHFGGIHPKDDDLMDVAEHLPNLSGIGVDMWSATSGGIQKMVQSMGSTLHCIRVQGDTITEHYLSDGTLTTIATSCPNLIEFAYKLSRSYYKSWRDSVTHSGVIALVKGCRKLERLHMVGTQNVSIEAFEVLVSLLEDSNEETNLRHLCLAGLGDTFEGKKGERIKKRLEALVVNVSFEKKGWW